MVHVVRRGADSREHGGKLVQWTSKVSATDKFYASAAANVTLTEIPSQQRPPPKANGELTLDPNPGLDGQTVTTAPPEFRRW